MVSLISTYSNADRDKGGFYEGKWEWKYEEILSLYNRHEEELNYVASFVKKTGRTGFGIRILRKTNQVVFDASNNREEDWQAYTKIGYKKDEKFEEYLRTLIVDQDLEQVYRSVNGDIEFGSNQPITYSENDWISRYGDDPPLSGRIKGNWYYFVQQFE